MRALYLTPLLGLLGCSGGLATITVDFEDTTTVEGGGLLTELVGTLGFDGFTQMNIVDAQELANQGVEPGDIQEVFLSALELTALSPDGSDLSFIESLDVYVESPNLPEVLVASQNNFPAGQAFVTFDLEDVDLTEYVVSESLTLFTDVTGNQPAEDTKVQAYVALDIRVTARGVINQARSDDD
jgi:hypothetical protein